MNVERIHNGIAWDETTKDYAVALGGEVLGHFPTHLQALRALENGTGHTLGDPGPGVVGEWIGTTEQERPTDAHSAHTAQRPTPYQQTLARLRAECEECADGTSRPEHVGHLSWHEWGHRLDGAPGTTHPHCTCGTELRNTPRFWHCGGCHETFSGERSFTRHRRGAGDSRECLDPRNSAGGLHWQAPNGQWGYGPRREFQGAPRTTGGPAPEPHPLAA